MTSMVFCSSLSVSSNSRSLRITLKDRGIIVQEGDRELVT